MTSLAAIRLAVFDFDGVFSDNRVWTNERGEESVACWRGDSLGLRRLDEVGVDYFVITQELNEAVPARARKIRIECISGVEDKLGVLRVEAERRGVPLAETAYLGNDVNDSECLAAVGLPVVPADAWHEVVPLASLVLTRGGGLGCVREFCDAVWHAKRIPAGLRARQFVGSVLVRNEDVFLERAIRNAADFCDRMHVLDHMSDDRTPRSCTALADELGTLDVRRSSFSGDSHKPLEPYAGTPTWVLVVDGDCIFDPDGLDPPARAPRPGRARRRVPAARARAALRRDRRRRRNRVRVHGAALASDRAALQLRRLAARGRAVTSACTAASPSSGRATSGTPCGTSPRPRSWDADPLRFVHTCFLRRSTADPESGEGRPNLNELRGYRRGLLGRIRRAVRRPALDPRVQELHRRGLNWKQAKYRARPARDARRGTFSTELPPHEPTRCSTSPDASPS